MFKIEPYYNPFLAPLSRRLDAVITITNDPTKGPATTDAAPGPAPSAPASRVLATIIVDCSGSMFNNPSLIESAKHAARRGIANLPPDALFCVIAFGSVARVVVAVCQATAANKAIADRAVRDLEGLGGTEMSKGLRALRQQIESKPGLVAWAWFLTDGQNEGETPATLTSELALCKGLFQCDCRGVGTNWRPDELRLIATTLNGTADAVANPENLEADFRRCIEAALGRTAGGVSLELWTPARVRLVGLRRMQPDNADILPLVARKSDRVSVVELGAWSAESRDYHAVFDVDPDDVGEEVMICRPAIVWTDANGEPQKASGQVVATWSEDADKTARISPEVAHYTGQAELANSIKEGLLARDRGNTEEATRLFGRAAQIAAEAGNENEEVTRRLSKVVDIIDASGGTVRLRRDVSKGEELELEMGGTRTVRRAK